MPDENAVEAALRNQRIEAPSRVYGPQEEPAVERRGGRRAGWGA
ncbi:hypothetical protein SAMN04487819_111141 [Actinopolyspora alba]|uniref:Uncharacterized protein n=1 Tax=Actinopolyspora alba TaxID=673379 RepID=A0A1I1ZWB8_9ACTN|nr:hypothetical protein [Actinopolyspora alba]SFE34923.1 hypothetical protein SAMN04487819_111141 [Actinopolyspora alba]